jgi:phage terminase large subunit-like protein
MIRESLVVIGKGSGKTELGAILKLGGLQIDKENSPENYSVAGDELQARHMFKAACKMVWQNSDMSRMFKVYESEGLIYCHKTQGEYRALSSKVETKDGAKPHMVDIDETHVQQTEDLINIFLLGMGKRDRPLISYWSTFGENMSTRPLGRLVDYGKQVIKGNITDNRFHCLLFMADEKDRDNWEDEEVIKKANPSYPENPTKDHIERVVKKAKFDIATRRVVFLKHLNLEAQGEDAGFDMQKWAQCATKFKPEDFKGIPCVIGKDLAASDDLNALVAVWKIDELFWLYPWYWMPKNSIKKRPSKHRDLYEKWVEQGHITAVDGDIMDYTVMHEFLEDFRDNMCPVTEIRSDPAKATLADPQLEKKGFKVVQVPPSTPKFGPACRLMRDLHLTVAMRHPNHPVLNFNAEKVVLAYDKHLNFIFDKDKSEEKIDGATAGALGLSYFFVPEEENPSSHYEQNGIDFF